MEWRDMTRLVELHLSLPLPPLCNNDDRLFQKKRKKRRNKKVKSLSLNLINHSRLWFVRVHPIALTLLHWCYKHRNILLLQYLTRQYQVVSFLYSIISSLLHLWRLNDYGYWWVGVSTNVYTIRCSL